MLLIIGVAAGTCHAGQVKTLTVYSVTGFSLHAGRIFRQDTGVKVRVIGMNGNGAAFERIKGEHLHPKADVWLGGSLGAHAQASFEGFTTSFRPANWKELDPRFRDPLGNYRVMGLYMGALGIVVNTAYLENKGTPLPTGWQSLLSDSYQGMIGMKSPLVSGTAYTTVSTLVQLMGEETALNYFKNLSKNLSSYTHSHTRRVSLGQLGMTITFAHEAIEEMAVKKDNHLKVIYPEEGTGYEIGGISLIKNGPNPEAAKHFINFVLSERGQRLFAKTNYQLPVHLKVQKHALPSFDEEKMRLINYDFSWSGKHRQRLIENYKKKVLAEGP
ncbi:MAG: extracellular solute-binding protein [Desulfobacteraceae bacterium]|nr:extracellular solute-binding protein [Desulfobacteraceae bacterium]